MDYTLSKSQRLKSKTIIDLLFKHGKGMNSYPLRIIYLKTEFSDNAKIKVGFSVGKRNIKKAVDRNRLKRILREAYRLNRGDNFNNISDSYALMILYLGKSGTDFASIEPHVKRLLGKFHKEISKN